MSGTKMLTVSIMINTPASLHNSPIHNANRPHMIIVRMPQCIGRSFSLFIYSRTPFGTTNCIPCGTTSAVSSLIPVISSPS